MSTKQIRIIGTKMSANNKIVVDEGATWGTVKELLKEKGLLSDNMQATCSRTQKNYENDSELIDLRTTAILTAPKMSNAGF